MVRRSANFISCYPRNRVRINPLAPGGAMDTAIILHGSNIYVLNQAFTRVEVRGSG